MAPKPEAARLAYVFGIFLAVAACFAGAQALAQNAYITNSGVPPDVFGTWSVIDTTSNTVTATIPVGIAPFGVAVTPPFTPPSCSTGKSWLHFRPPPVDFCCSRLAIGAATERA